MPPVLQPVHVAKLLSPFPYGFHIPIKWQDVSPATDDVIVHVRLKTEDEEMLCEAELKVRKVESIADWTPRGRKSR